MLAFLVAAVVLVASQEATLAQETTMPSFIEGFTFPEDLLDIQGSPYIIVSEFGGAPNENRNNTGFLSVYDTVGMQRIDLELIPDDANTLSSLADPICENLPLDQLNPHGNDGYQDQNGLWQIAVLNHFRYESVEFYEYDPAQPSQVTTRGCVVLVEDDFHNAVNYSPDTTQMAVTVFFSSLFGFSGSFSFLRGLFGADVGGLKVVSAQGNVTTVSTALNSANGVIWGGLSGNELFVAESLNNQIVVLNASNSFEQTPVAIPAESAPDNFRPDTPTSFLFTTISTSLLNILLCSTFGFFCNTIGFEVERYDWANETTTRVFSMGASVLNQVTVALIKDGVLYVTGFQSEVILQVPL